MLVYELIDWLSRYAPSAKVRVMPDGMVPNKYPKEGRDAASPYYVIPGTAEEPAREAEYAIIAISGFKPEDEL